MAYRVVFLYSVSFVYIIIIYCENLYKIIIMCIRHYSITRQDIGVGYENSWVRCETDVLIKHTRYTILKRTELKARVCNLMWEN